MSSHNAPQTKQRVSRSSGRPEFTWPDGEALPVMLSLLLSPTGKGAQPHAPLSHEPGDQPPWLPGYFFHSDTFGYDVALLSLRQRRGDLLGVFDEELRHRAQGAIFQGHDPRRSSPTGEFHGQDLERGKRCEMQRRFLRHG